MKYNILILILSISSCVSFLEDQIRIIDSDILPFYEMFIYEGIKRGKNFSMVDISIRFSDNIKTRGSNYHRIDHVVDILINKGLWDQSNNNVKEVLIMHELGHGILGRDHKKNCNSIMIKGAACKYVAYIRNRKEMLDELFK